ncbi:MAG TPA: HDIG domain-containing protein [Candidatus Limnocylindrales bacterium]|nr:HDIG domain-containing protein [Candidatus Limnocylindrales bacterium]
MTAALTAILAVDIAPSQGVLAVGDIALGDIRAPRTTSYESDILTAEAIQEARLAVEPQYDFTAAQSSTLAAQQAAALVRLVAPVDAAFAAITDDERVALLGSVLPELSDAGRTVLIGLSRERWTAARDEAGRVLDSLLRSELRDTQVAPIRSSLAGRMGSDLDEGERALAAELIAPLVVPNSSFSELLTSQARDRAAEAIEPVTRQVRQGEVVVRDGGAVTALDLEALTALGLGTVEPQVTAIAGWALLAALLVGMVLAWIWRFRPVLWNRDNVLVLVGLTIVFFAFALKLTADRSILPYFIPTAAAGMLLTILLDASLAGLVVALIALIGGGLTGSLELATYILLGGLAGIVAIRRGDRYAVFLQAGVACAAVYAGVVLSFALLGSWDTTGLVQLLGASAAAAAGSAIAAIGTFAVLGNVFGILTVFQLLELANPSQPLLRRLLVEAPGTYHHSLMVGNLAERAAEAVGADPLLVRVAAYYHDIGKLEDPQAFIENQAGGENIHDILAPAESAQVLGRHVRAGIDLAYRNRLPKSLIAFIPQHHGTSRMSYFWAKARGEAAAPYGGPETVEGRRAADALDESTYRHGGPKPQSREAAILMLADGVEASVRSLSSRDEVAIRAMVGRIIAERLEDGQFDECDLTLRDLERTREAFVGQLLGMYHQRIAYPQNKVVELESRRAAGGDGA